MNLQGIIDIVLFLAVVLIPAIVLHELAHGLSANLLGDPTAKNQGRLSLNPLRHVDPVGSIIVPGLLFLVFYLGMTRSLMLFGWAKPVPVNFRNLKPLRLGIALVALAGPLTNVLLAFIFSRLYVLFGSSHGALICDWAINLNLTLAVFNMVPIPPLDGSRVVTSLLPMKLAYYYNRIEPFGIFIVLILMQLGLFAYLYPIEQMLAGLIGVEI